MSFLSILKITKEDFRLLTLSAFVIGVIVSFMYVGYARTEAVNLSVTIESSMTFSISTNNFSNLTAGEYQTATSTLSVETNNAAGWNVTLYGDDQGTSDTVMDLTTDASVGITDQTEWVPASATTSAGNGVTYASLDSSGDVLAFRVMSASGSVPFRSTAWWGSDDAFANALWAGIPSSTIQRKIGDAGNGSYSSAAHLNTVLFYLDVSSSQQAGSYSGGLTFTATAN